MSTIYLRRNSAAQYVRDRYGFPCSRNWLAKLAVHGGGPAYRKVGRFPIYAPCDLDQWAIAKISPVQTSTAVTVGGRANV